MSARKQVVQEINAEENQSRKREHQKRFDVYRERQDAYLMQRLEREFNTTTVSQMRKIFSVNLTTRIIDEMSSIYNVDPEREFGSDLGRELRESELLQLNNLYDYCKVNQELRKANKFYNLHDQGALMVVPDKQGSIKVKAIPPIHYDVIPDCDNVEKAYAYILNVWDFDTHKTVRGNSSEPTQLNSYRQNDRVDQSIADDNDRKKYLERYVVWTDELHFTMNGHGEIIGEPIANPIGRLPFIDVATDKDFQFFVRRGTSVVDFALDFGLILSDTANTIRLQNYSQAIMTSEKPPQDLVVGPNHVLWLPLDPNNPGATPTFTFASPSPDISGSLEFAEMILRMFLSSRGIDPATITGGGGAKSFSSGVERLLAMLDKFEATRSDYGLFKDVEQDVFNLLVAWSNEFQSVSGEGELDASLRNGVIGDDVYLDVKYNEPVAVQTKQEVEDSVIKLMGEGLLSRREAIMELRQVSEEVADKILMDINNDMLGGGFVGEVQESTGEVPEEQLKPEVEG